MADKPVNGADSTGAPATNQPETRFAGFIDKISSSILTGWVVDMTLPERMVTVRVKISGMTVATVTADKIRTDVGRKFGTKGRHAFEYRFPADLASEEIGSISVLADRSDLPLPVAHKVTQNKSAAIGLSGEIHNRSLKHQLAGLTRPSVRPEITGPDKRIAVIVLNRNGSAFLENFFSTFFRRNTYEHYDIVVIDHSSDDNSFDLIETWKSKLNIIHLQRGSNASFSESNNLGADHASNHKYLCFVNNDIEWRDDLLPYFVNSLKDEAVGAVGVKLLRRETLYELGEEEPHHLGIAFDFTQQHRPFQPYELHMSPGSAPYSNLPVEVAAATAAVLMVRRTDFAAVGGFDEGYFYGYEDVDLCLTIRSRLGKKIISLNNLSAVHDVSGTRSEVSNTEAKRIARNYSRLASRASAFVRGQRRAFLRAEPDAAIPVPLKIAFAVTSRDFAGAAADYFTAYELGEYLTKKHGWEVWYLEPEQWYDAEGFDVIVAMRHDYDPSKLRGISPYTAVVGWARNWFDSWARKPTSLLFDQIWCGSEHAADRIRNFTHARCPVIRIAANAERFQEGVARAELASDYCFTGSYFSAAREITDCCLPENIPHTFAVFGHGWENHEKFSQYTRGPVSYLSMPDVYASTKLVVDDANSTTIGWGSVNSRVYDALAAGVLVITNGVLGSHEVFGGKLPTYSSAAELTEKLNYFLKHDFERAKLTEELQREVLQKHSYSRRADEAAAALRSLLGERARLSIRQHGSDDKRGRIIENSLRKAFSADEMIRFRPTRPGSLEQVSRFGDDIQVEIALSGPRSNLFKTVDGSINILVDLAEEGSISQKEYAAFDTVIRPDSGERSHPLDLEAITPALQHAAKELLLGSTPVGKSECFSSLRGEDLLVIPPSPRLEERFRVVFFPDYRGDNPYQDLLYSEFPGGTVTAGTLDDAIRALGNYRGERIFFHLHWTSVVIGAAKNEEEAKKRVEYFIAKLSNFKKSGGRLLWTVHNRVSHESRFREQELSLCRQLSELADNIHVHSFGAVKILEDLYALPREKTFVGVHGNYLKLAAEAPSLTVAKGSETEGLRSRLGIPSSSTVFLFLGQVRAYKGVIELIRSFKELLLTSADAHLIIAGSVFGVDESALRTEAEGNPRIHFSLGYIRNDKLSNFFSACDAVVLPYRDILTSGSLMLAFSFGRPVIAPAIGTLPEFARSGENALLYSDLEQSLSQALRAFIDIEASQRKKLGRAARRTALALPWRIGSGALLREVALPEDFVRRTMSTTGEERTLYVRAGSSLTSKAEVATVVVHYSGLGDTIRCIASLREQTGVEQAIILVCNSENPLDAIRLSELSPEFTVVQTVENIGYAGGNNIGLALAAQAAVPWFWIVNPDCSAAADYLRAFLDAAEEIDSEGLFGSTIVFGQSPEKIWFCGGDVSELGGIKAEHRHIGRSLVEAPVGPFECDYLTGANILGKISTFERVGYMPEDYFLYFEETDWCLRARDLGVKRYVLPDLVLNHWKRSESGGLPTQAYFYYYIRNNVLLSRRRGFHQDTLGPLNDFASGWLAKIRSCSPDKFEDYLDLFEIALEHGKMGLTGRTLAPAVSS